MEGTSRGRRGLGEIQILKHNQGNTTEEKKKKKSDRIGQNPAAVSAASSRRCPPSRRPPAASHLSLFICYLPPPGAASRAAAFGAAAAEPPPSLPGRPPRSGSRQPAPPASPRFPRPKPRPGPFLLPLAFVLPLCSPQRGLPPPPCPFPLPRRWGNRRGNKETNFGKSHGAAIPAGLLGSRGWWGSKGAFWWVSPHRVDPVPLLRVGPSKVGKPPRVSLPKRIKNRCGRRVCLKPGCGSTPGHFRLSSTALYQSPDDCGK